MNFIKENAGWVALVILVILGAWSLVSQKPALLSGASTDCGQTTCLTGLSVVTSNSATSSAAFGCIQGVATSTATPIHLEFSTTTSLATFTGGLAPTGTLGGGVSWRYGACPI